MIESSSAFGPANGLVGTFCLPDGGGRPAAVGMILFNAGMVHRVGPHRLNVRLARLLAAAGIPSLRFDLAGQGDSLRAAGAAGFEEQAVADLRAAMDALGQEAGVSRFAIFGFCSGGVHGYAAAKVEPRLAGLLMYDTYAHKTWKTRVNRYVMRGRRRGFAAATVGWLGRKAAALARRVAGTSGDTQLARAAGLFRTPARDEFAADVRAMHERGVTVGAIYSGSFVELYNYRGQFRDAFTGTGIEDVVGVDFHPALGHNVMSMADQSAFMRRIADWTLALDGRLRAGAR